MGSAEDIEHVRPHSSSAGTQGFRRVPTAMIPATSSQSTGQPSWQTEDRATGTAKGLAGKHPGVRAWSRDANPSLGEYGEPTTLFVGGDVPDMEWRTTLEPAFPHWFLHRSQVTSSGLEPAYLRPLQHELLPRDV